MELKQNRPGVDKTGGPNLRVSVAVLVSVLFKNPANGKVMLALERTATLRQDKGKAVIEVRAKPFGGGVRIIKPGMLKEIIGEFQYDSERSLEQQDFRIQINPGQWKKVEEICEEHQRDHERGIFDISPERELTEEFEDSLHIKVTPDEYHLRQKGMLTEETVSYTDNINAHGLPTVRIYYLFDAVVTDPEIIRMILDNSERYSDADLHALAAEDAGRGGKGRAKAMLAVVLDELREFYRSAPGRGRKGSEKYMGYRMNGNVPAVLDDIEFK